MLVAVSFTRQGLHQLDEDIQHLRVWTQSCPLIVDMYVVALVASYTDNINSEIVQGFCKLMHFCDWNMPNKQLVFNLTFESVLLQ